MELLRTTIRILYMPDMFLNVGAGVTVPVNLVPLLDDTDFVTRETAIVYNQAGMDLVWNFLTTTGVLTQAAVVPTSDGDYDWVNKGDGMYGIGMPASGGASINNNTEGVGWFSGVCDGVLPWRGPAICFRAASINALLINGTALETRLAELDAENLPGDIDAIAGYLGTEIPVIKAKTDNLPADPASETNVNVNETKIDTLQTAITKIENLLSGKMEWDAANSRFKIYNQSDVLAWYLYVKDKDGNNVVMTGTGPAQRNVKVAAA